VKGKEGFLFVKHYYFIEKKKIRAGFYMYERVKFIARYTMIKKNCIKL
jgi:hypothetical protein